MTNKPRQISTRTIREIDEQISEAVQAEMKRITTMARLAELLGHDPGNRSTPLGDKLLARTKYDRVETPHECNRWGCSEMAVLWFQSGNAKRRYLCQTHVVATVADMAGAEERTHVPGLPELLADLLRLAD